MRASEITALITDSASNQTNPQLFAQLHSLLSEHSQPQVALGLLKVFTHGSPPPTGSDAQRLAGRLLLTLQPQAKLDLGSVLRACLPRYEPSVKQLPYYLGQMFGTEQVLRELRRLAHEPLAESERRAMETMQGWLHLPQDPG